LYSADARALADRSKSDASVAATVRDLGDLGFASDGLETDATGRIYLTDYEFNAIHFRDTGGTYHIVARDPRMLWPDTLSVATDGYLYFNCNQLERQSRFHGGMDLRQKPYFMFRVRIDSGPVKLK
jgi:sugar lactone lactonase YvrE